jgi:hypothetical protein
MAGKRKSLPSTPQGIWDGAIRSVLLECGFLLYINKTLRERLLDT